MNKLLLLLLLAISTAAPAATTGYITDKLEITLRSGQSTKHKILRMLPSGSAIKVLKEGDEGKYLWIQTAQGTKGWVLARHIDKLPSARQRLTRANQRLGQLKKDNIRLKKELGKFGDEKRALGRDKSSLTIHSNKLQRELDRIKRVSADVLGTDRENRTLKTQLQQLQTNHDQSQQQISALQDSTARDWLVVGAGVTLLGIILGLIIPKIRWKKKSDWGTL